jgi:hypothetical protein
MNNEPTRTDANRTDVNRTKSFIEDPASPEAIKAARQHFRKRLASDRGDVPGWVLITLMTAGLVVMMWGLAGPALQGVFDAAMNKVVAF